MQKIGKTVAIFALAFLAATSSVTRSHAAPQVLDGQAMEAGLKQAGSVRVLVRLATVWNGTDKPHWVGQPKGYLQALPGEQRAAITKLLGTGAFGAGPAAKRLKIKLSRYSPGFSATVTPAEFAALATSPLVTAIQPEVTYTSTLDASLPRINAPAAIAAGGDGSGQAVVVIDTGVDRTHPFLSGKVVREACFSTNLFGALTSTCPNGNESQTGVGSGQNCNLTIGGCDHGTHVAGIIAGRNPTAVGPRRGVAPSAKIVAIQASSRSTACGSEPAPCAIFNPLDIIDAMGFVIDRVKNNDIPGARIAAVNMSLGSGGTSGDCDLLNLPLKIQIDFLRSKGVATVIASGNDGERNKVSSPGCISSAITVSSTNTGDDKISSFSNMGRTVDLLAPGKVIDSSVPGGGFAGFQGTSMAAPHVAGAIADLKDREPTATVDLIEQTLKQTGKSVTDTRTGGSFTRTRINVGNALTTLVANNPDVSVTPTTRQSLTKASLIAFQPSGITYTLHGQGNSFRYKIRNVPIFLNVSDDNGVVPRNGSRTVRITPAAAAFFLPAGTYSRDITVENLDAIGDIATIKVQVVVP